MTLTSKIFTTDIFLDLSAKDNTAIRFDNRSISYNELKNFVIKAALVLKEKGIAQNDYVILKNKDRFEFVILILALWYCNAVVVPINIEDSEFETNEILIQFTKGFIISDVITNTKLIKINPNEIFSDKKKINSLSKFTFKEIDIDSEALVIFSSGSNNKPKGVIHTYKSIYNSVKATLQFVNSQKEESWLASLPFYHIGGFLIILRALLSKGELIIPPIISTQQLIKSMEKEKPNYVSLVPKMLFTLLEKKFIPSNSLKKIFIGGSSISKEIITKALQQKLPLAVVYGSSETCAMISAIDTDNLKRYRLSSGKIIGNGKIKIKKSEKEKIGEILISSNRLFKGYIGKSSNTRKNFNTGDLGYFNEEGFLFVVGRKDNMIITGGKNIFPSEIEKIIITNKKIKEVIIFGISDFEWGEIICAAIIKEEENLTEEEIKTFLKGKISNYKIPKKIFFVKAIEKTPLGKISLPKLKKKLNLI